MISQYRNKANITAENFTFTNKTNTPKQLPNHKETPTNHKETSTRQKYFN